MIKLNGHTIYPTIFPDKTSQVWKVPEEYFLAERNIITWEFENEAEFFHVAQLKYLLNGFGSYNTLELPYLPFARQDKIVSNTATFAFWPFVDLLNSLCFSEVKVYDPHNVNLTKQLIDRVEITMPKHQSLLSKLKAKPVYPDKGAAERYEVVTRSTVIFDKDRDPLTGNIKGVKLIKGKIEPRTYLIIDDICDGGRTFIEVAKELYRLGAKEVHLYVSHGIFSKGLEPLREAGIKRIFTRKGEVK